MSEPFFKRIWMHWCVCVYDYSQYAQLACSIHDETKSKTALPQSVVNGVHCSGNFRKCEQKERSAEAIGFLRKGSILKAFQRQRRHSKEMFHRFLESSERLVTLDAQWKQHGSGTEADRKQALNVFRSVGNYFRRISFIH